MESLKSPSPGLTSSKKEMGTKSNQFQVGTIVLYGVPIVSLVIENQERLCLAQISNTLLKQFSYNEIHNRRVALGITCVQCTPVQLEILRRAGAMPVSSRRCGMITRREAERLCKSFLGDNAPPRLPEDFAFAVHHECAWGCRGSFLPSRYNSSRAKCIKCAVCGLFFSPNKFIFHSHRLSSNDKYIQPDAANFNSWRRHMKLSGNPPEEIVHAWEDVKAMFNGGTRKRLLAHSVVSRPPKQNKIESAQPPPIIPSPRIPNCQDITLPISRVAMDFIYHKPLAFSSYSTFPWLKRNSILFPPENPFFPIDKTYQSAFKPVQPVNERTVQQKDEESDDEVDIETTDEKLDETNKWNLNEEKNTPVELTLTRSDIGHRDIVSSSTTPPTPEPPTPAPPPPPPLPPAPQPHLSTTPSSSSSSSAGANIPSSSSSSSLVVNGQQNQSIQRDEVASISHRIWNLSRLSFENNNDRTNFLYRQDLHRHFSIDTGNNGLDHTSQVIRNPIGMSMGIKPSPLDCTTCISNCNSVYSTTDNEK